MFGLVHASHTMHSLQHLEKCYSELLLPELLLAVFLSCVPWKE